MSGAIETLNLSSSPARAASDNLIAETLRNLLRNRSAIAGLLIIAFFIFLAIFAPQVATFDPVQSMIGQPGETGKLPGKAPCFALFGWEGPQHILGLDLNARDVYSRIVYVTRTSPTVGFSSVLIAVIRVTLIVLLLWDAGVMINNVVIWLWFSLMPLP